jgi:excisionase family DNA binding protein
MRDARSATSLLAQEIGEYLSRAGIATKRLYTVQEAATYLGVSETTLRKFHREGAIRDVNLGISEMRFDIKDLDRFIEERKQAN